MKDYLRLLPKNLFEKKANEASVDSLAQLEAVRQEFHAIAEQLSVPTNLVEFHTRQQDDGAYHLEVMGDEYHYISTERGKTLDVRTTRDPEDVLFWLTENLTRSMASEYELNHRVERRDSRRLWMAKHVEYMQSINPAWAARVTEKYEAILVNYPFDDRPWYEVYPECVVDEGAENQEDLPER
jgi:hypothetical protein